MNRKIVIAAIVLALVCVGGIAAHVLMTGARVQEPVAEIYVDGVLERRAELSREQSFTISTEHGYNEILIENGAISVTSSDCPDKVCVSTGATNSGVVTIICLPHRLEIRIVSGATAEIDAQIR